MIKFSFITTLYNSKIDDIMKLLSSIGKLLIDEVEIIFIDDFSTDTSALEFIEEYKQRNISHNITILKCSENTRRVGAFIKGIKEAKGQYLMSLDSDDFIDKSVLRRFIYEIIPFNWDFIMIPTMVRNVKTNKSWIEWLIKWRFKGDSYFQVKSINQFKGVPYVAAMNSVVRTVLAQSIDYNATLKCPHDDAYFSAMWVSRSNSFFFANYPFFIYNKFGNDESNSSNGNLLINLDNHNDIVKESIVILNNNHYNHLSFLPINSLIYAHYQLLKDKTDLEKETWLKEIYSLIEPSVFESLRKSLWKAKKLKMGDSDGK